MTINCSGHRRIAIHTTDQEEEVRHHIKNSSFWRGCREGGDEKNGYGENTEVIVPCPNARTYTVDMTAVLISPFSYSGSSSSVREYHNNNGNDYDNNDDAYTVIVLHSLLQKMSENTEVGVGRGGVVERGRGRQGNENDRDNCDRGPDSREYTCPIQVDEGDGFTWRLRQL